MIGDAAAGIGAVAFFWLTVFQLMLAAGVPLGRLAWGGQSARLSGRLRWASLASAGLAGLGGMACLQAGNVLAILPQVAMRPLLGAMAVQFGISVFANAASSSLAERLHGVPLALAIAMSCGVLALGL